MSSRFVTLIALALSTLALGPFALAQQTVSTHPIWGVVYDSSNRPIAGVTGKFCLQVTFTNGETAKECSQITANAHGQFWTTPSLRIWTGHNEPTASHEITFEVQGITVTGSSTIFKAECDHVGHGPFRIRYFDSSCVQRSNIDFRMPFPGQCDGKFEKDAIGRLVCVPFAR